MREIRESEKVVRYLQERNLVDQYRKAKEYLLLGFASKVRFKKRKPKTSGLWYFRINDKFRAEGYFDDENDFIVSRIDDHQHS